MMPLLWRRPSETLRLPLKLRLLKMLMRLPILSQLWRQIPMTFRRPFVGKAASHPQGVVIWKLFQAEWRGEKHASSMPPWWHPVGHTARRDTTSRLSSISIYLRGKNRTFNNYGTGTTLTFGIVLGHDDPAQMTWHIYGRCIGCGKESLCTMR